MGAAGGIRRLRPGDEALLADLNTMFGTVFGDPETYVGRRPGAAHAARLLTSETVILLAALEGDRVVGGLAAYELLKSEQERSEIYLYDLAVMPECRRAGIATALIVELRRIAREVGAWVIFVQADQEPEDEAAIALYRKLAESEEAPLHFDIAP